MIRLSKKFIRRAITGLALLAPVVYLFGSQFFALAGAHGVDVLASDDAILSEDGSISQNYSFIDTSVSSLGISSQYVRLNNLYGNSVLSDGDILDSYASSFSNGVYSYPLPDVPLRSCNNYRDTLSSSGILTKKVLALDIANLTFSRDGDWWYYSSNNYVRYTSDAVFTTLSFDSTSSALGNYSFSGSGYFRIGGGGLSTWADVKTYYLFKPIYLVYINPVVSSASSFDYDIRLYDGLNVSFDSPVALGVNFFVPSKVIYESSYRDNLFDNMFGKSNFLSSWGQDAISDNPHGFAPFGNMLQFVDENMLHLSDKPIGLMGYGYFYYCAHVLLFVCFFDLTTFFLNWILRISHKFGGADYED